ERVCAVTAVADARLSVVEPEVEAQFREIRSILHAMAERENRMEIRFDQKHAQAMERMDRQHAIAMQRMDRMDKQIQATANLVRAGMKIVAQLVRDTREMKAETREMKAEMREIARRQDAFLRGLRNGHSKN